MNNNKEKSLRRIATVGGERIPDHERTASPMDLFDPLGILALSSLHPEPATVYSPNDSRNQGTDSLGKPVMRQVA